MKKIFALVAVAAMVSFTACTNNNTDAEGEHVEDTAQVEVIAEPTPEPVPVDTTASVDTTNTAPANANAEAAH